jgi:hypothetical protein
MPPDLHVVAGILLVLMCAAYAIACAVGVL